MNTNSITNSHYGNYTNTGTLNAPTKLKVTDGTLAVINDLKVKYCLKSDSKNFNSCDLQKAHECLATIINDDKVDLFVKQQCSKLINVVNNLTSVTTNFQDTNITVTQTNAVNQVMGHLTTFADTKLKNFVTNTAISGVDTSQQNVLISVLMASVMGIELNYKAAQTYSQVSDANAKALDRLQQLTAFLSFMASIYTKASAQKNKDANTTGAQATWDLSDEQYFKDAGYDVRGGIPADKNSPEYLNAKAKVDLENQILLATINDPEFQSYAGKNMSDDVARNIYNKYVVKLDPSGSLSKDDIGNLTNRFNSIIDNNKDKSGNDYHVDLTKYSVAIKNDYNAQISQLSNSCGSFGIAVDKSQLPEFMQSMSTSKDGLIVISPELIENAILQVSIIVDSVLPSTSTSGNGIIYDTEANVGWQSGTQVQQFVNMLATKQQTLNGQENSVASNVEMYQNNAQQCQSLFNTVLSYFEQAQSKMFS